MSVHAWAATDIGRKRKHNEDSFLVDPELGLYVVADGMGGHAAGEVASARCVEIVRETILADKDKLDLLEQGKPDVVEALMAKAIQRACAEIYKLAEKEPSKRGMGTTCVALLQRGKKGVIGHVGDSRAYLHRHGRVHQLTEDHSLVEEHIKRGLMTRAEAEKSEIRNVITRAVGIQANVQVDTLVTDITPGDVVLLCSDGLHGYFVDGELPDLLGREPRSTLPRQLVDLANQRGGKDNITAIVVFSGAEQGADEGTDIDQKAEILRRIPLFQYMNYKELLSILAIAQGRAYQPGESIVKEGEPGDDMFVLFRGKVNVSKGDQPIAILKAGGHFGEMSLIDQAPRSASIDAVDATSAVALGRDALLKLMRKDSLLAVKLLWSFTQVLSERLRNTNEALSGLKDEVEKLRSEALEIEEVRPPPPPFGGE